MSFTSKGPRRRRILTRRILEERCLKDLVKKDVEDEICISFDPLDLEAKFQKGWPRLS